MANWWEEAPVADAGKGTPQAAPSGSWWLDAPVANAEERKALAEEEAARKRTGTFSRFTNAVIDPALFGTRDVIEGFGRASGELIRAPFRASTYGYGDPHEPPLAERMSKAYQTGRDEVRAEMRANEKDFGWGPGLLSMGLVGPGRAAAGMLPSFATRAAQAAKVGTGFGAATGFGSTQSAEDTTLPEAVGNRLWGAAKGAAFGGVMAPAISEVAVPAVLAMGRAPGVAARYASRAMTAARDPEEAAINTVADKLAASGIDPAQLRASLTPRMSANLQARGLTDENLADIISRQMRGETATAVAQDHGLSPATARRYFTAYQDANPTPRNIIDVTKELAGSGGSALVTRMGRAAYSLAGDETGAPAAEALMGRQQTQPGRVADIIRRSVGGQEFEPALQTAQQNLAQESAQAYRGFYSEPDLASNQLHDLMEDPLFRRANIQAQRQARVEAIRANQDAVRAGQPPFEPVPTVDPRNEVFTPRMLDLIQRQLRIAGEGFASNPNNARHAQNLRQVFLDRIEQHYPTFRGIRQNYAEGRMGEDAMNAGATMATRLGASAREVLRGFEDMTPAQQELTRLGFSRKLLDMAANSREGAAVANQFQTPAVREIIERLFPQGTGAEGRAIYQRGQDLLTNLRREAITTATKNDVLAGSRTAELLNDMGRMMEGAETAANVATGRFHHVLGNLATRLTSEIGSRGAGEVLRVLTETDPARILPLLNRLAQAAQTASARRAYLDAAKLLRAQVLPSLGAQVGAQAGYARPRAQIPAVAR